MGKSVNSEHTEPGGSSVHPWHIPMVFYFLLIAGCSVTSATVTSFQKKIFWPHSSLDPCPCVVFPSLAIFIFCDLTIPHFFFVGDDTYWHLDYQPSLCLKQLAWSPPEQMYSVALLATQSRAGYVFEPFEEEHTLALPVLNVVYMLRRNHHADICQHHGIRRGTSVFAMIINIRGYDSSPSQH